MTYTAWATRPLYAAITTRLETTGKLVGQAVAPDTAPPYMVLYPLFAETDGSLSDPHEQLTEFFQITSVGDTMQEAQWMQAKARGVLLGHAPVVAGMTTTAIHLDQPLAVFREESVFSVADRYSVYVS